MTSAAVWKVFIAKKYAITKYVLITSINESDEKIIVDLLL
jgi:hypothetical protein